MFFRSNFFLLGGSSKKENEMKVRDVTLEKGVQSLSFIFVLYFSSFRIFPNIQLNSFICSFNSRKRKRELLSGMVNWTSAIAIHPFDPVAQTLPEPSKRKEYKGGQNFFVQILRARDVLSMRKCAEPNSGSSSKV